MSVVNGQSISILAAAVIEQTNAYIRVFLTLAQ